MPKPSPLLVVLSGPSGVGKDSVLRHLKDMDMNFHFTVTATTRAQRPGEEDGVDYLFMDRDTFHQMVTEDEFLECAQVYGNWYGVPKSQVRDAFAGGKDVFMKTDVQGAATIKELAPGGIFIFPHASVSQGAGAAAAGSKDGDHAGPGAAHTDRDGRDAPAVQLRVRGCERRA